MNTVVCACVCVCVCVCSELLLKLLQCKILCNISVDGVSFSFEVERINLFLIKDMKLALSAVISNSSV